MTGIEPKSDHDAPLVSVLICSFNAEKFIEATIRSVSKQTYRNLEILVRDNASSDGTVEVLERLGREDPRLRVYRGFENLGAYGGLNYLLDRANGTYIAIQDHDDIWHSDKIRRQIEFLEENGQFVGCGTAIINHYEKYDTYLLRSQPEVSRVAWHTSIVFRNTEKRYDVTIDIANDFRFMENALCRGDRLIHNFRDPLVLRRIRADGANLSSKWITGRNAKDVMLRRMSIKDKLPILGRLVLPQALFDRLMLRFFLRGNVLPKEAVETKAILSEFAS